MSRSTHLVRDAVARIDLLESRRHFTATVFDAAEIGSATQQWSVLLDRPEDIVLANGEVIPGMEFAFGPALRTRIQRKLDAVSPELKFQQNVGVAHAFTVAAPASWTQEQVKALLSRLPDFVDAAPVRPLIVSEVPNDPSYPSQWAFARIDAPTAWDYTTGWAGAAVAVIDSGVDLQHTDIDGNLWVNSGEIAGNGVDDDAIDGDRGQRDTSESVWSSIEVLLTLPARREAVTASSHDHASLQPERPG
jgi:hypothetical protein